MSDCGNCDILYDALRTVRDALDSICKDGPHVLGDAQRAYIDSLLSDDSPPPQEPWARLACEFNVETTLNPTYRDKIKRIAKVYGYDRCKLAMTEAVAKIGGGPGIITWAETYLARHAANASIDAEKNRKAQEKPFMRIDGT